MIGILFAAIMAIIVAFGGMAVYYKHEASAATVTDVFLGDLPARAARGRLVKDTDEAPF